MEQEVTGEEQALMAVKLADDVRKLIRDEVKAAMEDFGFLSGLYTYPLAEHMFRNISSSLKFQRAVRDAMIAQMNKY